MGNQASIPIFEGSLQICITLLLMGGCCFLMIAIPFVAITWYERRESTHNTELRERASERHNEFLLRMEELRNRDRPEPPQLREMPDDKFFALSDDFFREWRRRADNGGLEFRRCAECVLTSMGNRSRGHQEPTT